MRPKNDTNSYRVCGIYELDSVYNNTYFISNSYEHKFYFLPDSNDDLSWRQGQLKLEIIPISNRDTTLLLYGTWYLNKDWNMYKKFGDWNYEISISLVGATSVFAMNNFKIKCRNNQPKILLHIKRMDLGGVDSIVPNGTITNEDYNYLNLKDVQIRTIEPLYRKVKNL